MTHRHTCHGDPAAAAPAEHTHRHGDALPAHLNPEDADLARALRAIHEQLKLATLVAGGAVLLLDQARIGQGEFATRIEQAHDAFADGTARVSALAARSRGGDARLPAYHAAALQAHEALGSLRAAPDAGAGRHHRDRLRHATERLAAATRQMREIGETFWGPEYVLAGSEGAPHSH